MTEYLKINDITVPIRRATPQQTLDFIGRQQNRTASGHLMRTDRGRKKRWRVTTLPLTKEEYSALKPILQNVPPFVTVEGLLPSQHPDRVISMFCDVEINNITEQYLGLTYIIQFALIEAYVGAWEPLSALEYEPDTEQAQGPTAGITGISWIDTSPIDYTPDTEEAQGPTAGITDISWLEIVTETLTPDTEEAQGPTAGIENITWEDARVEFLLADYVDGGQSGSDGINWRGYRLQVNREVTIKYLTGGGTESGFLGAIYEAEGNVPKTLLATVAFTGSTAHQRVELSEPVTFEPGKVYIIAQGRESGTGNHHILADVIDVTGIEANEAWCAEWLPVAGTSLNFGVSGNAEAPLDQTPTEDTIRPAMGMDSDHVVDAVYYISPEHPIRMIQE